MTSFPWQEAMAFGLGRQRLSPRQFWAMTPRELACALRGAGAALPVALSPKLTGDDLRQLMQDFPDEVRA